MWIFVQIFIFIILVGISLFLSESAYMIIVVIAIIFTLVQVFVNWLLIIQIANILIAGLIGYSIIQGRDKLLKWVYRSILRIDENGNRIKLTNNSKIIGVTILCGVLIILFQFFTINYCGGRLMFEFISPFQWISYFSFYNIGIYINFFGNLLFLYYGCTYRNRKGEDFIKPLLIKIAILAFWIFQYSAYYGYDVVVIYGLEILSFTYILILLIMAIKNKIRSKRLIIALSTIPVIIAITFTCQFKFPFAPYEGEIFVSNLISFVSFCIGYGALMTIFKGR